MTFKADDKVIDDALGSGEIVRSMGAGLYLVQFDECPPWEYNCETNPCVRFGETMRKQEGADDRA